MQLKPSARLSILLFGLVLLGAKETHALSPDHPLWASTLVPVRKLTEPNKVYMKSVEVTLPTTGTGLPFTFHVYNPTEGAGVKLDLVAKTPTGAVDYAHTFSNVHITPIAKLPDGTWGQGSGRYLSNGSGQASLPTPFTGAGWFRIQFNYGAPNANRTLVFTATNYAGASLKIGWVDPSGEANLSLKAKFAVEQGKYVYFKGGAYKDPLSTTHAFADNIKVDTRLLYRKAFDQEQFNYPIGYLPAGDHTVEATFTRSGASRSKYWFGINETSFDPQGVKTGWNPVQFVYDGEMRTGDYDAWNEGVAFAQGSQLVAGVRPPPVRRGNIFTVSLESSALNGQTQNATLRIYPLNSGQQMAWTATRDTPSDYVGGYYATSGFSTRYRELWRVAVPADAAVGRYVLRAFAPNGVQVGSDVLFYVLHNPLTLVNTHPVSAAEVAAYGYDDDTDGVNLELDTPTDQDRDDDRDHFLAHLIWDPVTGQYGQKLLVTGVFRRTQGTSAFSMLDYAIAAASGTTDPFQTMRRLYRITSQRLRYGGAEQEEVAASFVGTAAAFPPSDAFTYSQPGTELPELKKNSGMCYTSAAVLASLARSVGLLSRMVVSTNSLGGWSDHGFTEVFIPTLPTHGGKTEPYDASPNSDSDYWYVFDATSPEGGYATPTRTWDKYSESLGTRAQYGRAAHVLSGNGLPPFNAVTNPPIWDPHWPDVDLTTNVLDVSAAYQSGPEFWMTSSGLTGWLGRGEKDIYRITRRFTAANAVRVQAITNDGAYLTPKICVGPTLNDPVMPQQCWNADTRFVLPSDDNYIVVFNDAPDLMSRRGDSIQYRIDLE